MTKVTVAGKGGSGKTTIAAGLARLMARRGLPVVAVDGDPNPNLATALGLPEDRRAALGSLSTRAAAVGVRVAFPETATLDEVAAQFGVDGPDGVRVIVGVTVTDAGAG